jgi:hypothetical protein
MNIFAATVFATTWAPVYPYIQKTENGKVKSHSVPYGVYDGPNGPGQTFVYANGKRLYTIEKYFDTPFFTTNNGQFLIEFDFQLNYQQPMILFDDNGKEIIEPILYDGKAVTIYKDGKLFQTINVNTLKIDTSKMKVNESGNWFAWHYMVSDTTMNDLKIKMQQHPVFIENDKLYLLTADNQLIEIKITTGEITDRKNAYETLKQKSNWTPTTVKRKYQKVKYPSKFLLPLLQNGETMNQGLATFLNKRITLEDSATIQLYIHTLLINKEGKCERVYVSQSKRMDQKKDFINDKEDDQLKIEIENWIKQQTYQTKTFPRDFQKFKYTDFVYLK